jgi:hypothetical protein
VQKGVAHFNNQEAAEEISNHIYEFIKKFWVGMPMKWSAAKSISWLIIVT